MALGGEIWSYGKDLSGKKSAYTLDIRVYESLNNENKMAT